MQKTYSLPAQPLEWRGYKLSFLQVITWGNRLALAIVFFWFGFLKIIHLSPAEQLVTHLHRVTIGSLMPIDKFIVLLGVAECLIGVLWLIPKASKIVFLLFLLHMTTTFLPLLFLKSETWQGTLTLTLTGQYIVKNLVLVASAATVLMGYHVKKNTARDQ